MPAWAQAYMDEDETRMSGGTRQVGRRLVELLSIKKITESSGSPKFTCKTITVFDTKRGQIIYRNNEQEETDGDGNLLLTGPYTGISADGNFAIEIDTGCTAEPIKWEWDQKKYGPTRELVTRGDGDEKVQAEVKYRVMPNALKATVKVMLRLKDSDNPSGIHGSIKAFICDVDEKESGGSVLFFRREGMVQHFHPKRSRFLQLARSVVAVPCGSKIRLKMDLKMKPSEKNVYFTFGNGDRCQRTKDNDGNEFEVNVTWAPTVQPSSQGEIEKIQRQPDIVYTVKDDKTFSTFIGEVRCKVADHPSQDVVDKQPVLAKEVTWLHIQLKIEHSKEVLTLVMRDDNLHVMGFMNQEGVWYELGDPKTDPTSGMLPPEYHSEPLKWGNSYKSILQVKSLVGVVKKLRYARLGRNFAADAVRVLSRFPESVADGEEPRLALAGVMVMICESAKLNPLFSAITRGWNTGTVFTKLLMDYILKWELISSALLCWKDHLCITWIKYPELERIGIQSPQEALDVIYLVHNNWILRTPDIFKYVVGDLVSFAYPKMHKETSRDMFNKMFMATVEIMLLGVNMDCNVYGKISALICKNTDKRRRFRAGSMLFTRPQEMGYRWRSDSVAPLPLLRSVVAVPSGWLLCIKVDLYIEVPIKHLIKHLKGTFTFDNKQRMVDSSPCEEVEVKIVNWVDSEKDKQDVPSQLSYPVKVLKTISGNPTVLYTIGDVMSFTEFIMAIRRVLADYREDILDRSEDILDGHPFSNLSTSLKHPVLAKQRAGRPLRWLHVKLQADGEETSSITLVMRPNNLSVIGFINQNGILYKLDDNNDSSKHMIPEEYHSPSKDLTWGDSINESLLNNNVKLGSGFAVDAVCVLSRYPTKVPGTMKAKVALAGLMVMVCDSARMNPVHKTIAGGWNTGTEFTEELKDLKWLDMSSALLRWKRSNYAEPNCCYSELRDVYLVANDDGSPKTESVNPQRSLEPEQSRSKETGELESREPNQPVVVYNIGDVMSFTEFIMALRGILAEHKDLGEDLLDDHDLLNISSTKENPMLPKLCAQQPARWLHIKLQVEKGEETSSTTLFMRDDNLYVCGFKNKDKVVYELVDNKFSVSMLPNEYSPQRLEWSLGYRSILEGKSTEKLGRDFAMAAVRRLSSSIHPSEQVADMMSARLALAGLIFMVCESARMNPVRDALADGWSNGIGFSKKVMDDYAQKHEEMSRKLWAWKSRSYAEPHCVSELQDTCLILNTRLPDVPPREKLLAIPVKASRSIPGDGSASASQSKAASASTASGSEVVTGGDAAARRVKRKAGNPPPAEPPKARRRMGGNTSASQAGGEVDDTGPSQGSEGNQPRMAGESTGPSQSVLVDDSQGYQTREDFQHEKTENAAGHGRPRVELLAVRADLSVIGTKIIVFDGKRGQIIYEQQREQKEKWNNLVLTGPHTGISAHGCFKVKIDIPESASIEEEWNCYDSNMAAQVDSLRSYSMEIIDNTADRRKVAEVLYAVMSNAREATVQVKLRLKDGHMPSDVYGTITALIQEFEHPSILFSRTEVTDQCLSHMDGESFSLQLARNVVAVPCGRVLHLGVDLWTRTTNNQVAKYFKDTLSFHNNGTCSQTERRSEVEVNVTWYPQELADDMMNKLHLRYDGFLKEHGTDRDKVAQKYNEYLTQEEEKHSSISCLTSAFPEASHQEKTQMSTDRPGKQTSREESSTAESSHPAEMNIIKGKAPEIVFPIDVVSFEEFIKQLRDNLARHPHGGDIMDGLSSARENPLLPKTHRGQPAKWFHIKLQVAGEKETSSVTLLVRDDNLYCHGFMNQKGVYYELSNPEGWKLPSKYKPVRLDWGITYESILNASDEKVEKLLEFDMLLGRTFAVNAVRELSCFTPHMAEGADASARLALAGLMIIVCEAAKMKPIHDRLALSWDTGVTFPKKLMEYVKHWELISISLLDWKDASYIRWTMHPKLEEITGIKNPKDALDVIHLVRNFKVQDRQLLWDWLFFDPISA